MAKKNKYSKYSKFIRTMQLDRVIGLEKETDCSYCNGRINLESGDSYGCKIVIKKKQDYFRMEREYYRDSYRKTIWHELGHAFSNYADIKFDLLSPEGEIFAEYVAYLLVEGDNFDESKIAIRNWGADYFRTEKKFTKFQVRKIAEKFINNNFEKLLMIDEYIEAEVLPGMLSQHE